MHSYTIVNVNTHNYPVYQQLRLDDVYTIS